MALDRVLQFHAQAAKSQGGAGIEVTLLVGGVLVSGQIVSASLYFTLLRGSAGGDHPPEVLEQYDAAMLELADEAEFIHLRNTRYFLANGQRLPAQGAASLWRGSLAGVSGYFLGSIPSE